MEGRRRTPWTSTHRWSAVGLPPSYLGYTGSFMVDGFGFGFGFQVGAEQEGARRGARYLSNDREGPGHVSFNSTISRRSLTGRDAAKKGWSGVAAEAAACQEPLPMCYGSAPLAAAGVRHVLASKSKNMYYNNERKRDTQK